MNDPQEKIEQALTLPESQARKLRWLLLVASIFFVIGVVTPMITISKFIVIKNSFSVLNGVTELLRGGHIILFFVVAGFSIILPILKIKVLYNLLSTNAVSIEKTKRYLHLMHEYGRWAMLDVMVVAVLIVTVKLGAIASIEVHYGLFLFGAAVLLIMIITNKIVHLTKEADLA